MNLMLESKEIPEEILDEDLKRSILYLTLASLMAVPKMVSASVARQLIDTSNTARELQSQYVNSVPGSQTDKLGYSTLQIINIIARTLWAEARNQGDEGIHAVASVIWNRANHDMDNLVEVCFAPRQFSCWNKAYPSVNTAYKPQNFQLKFPEEASINNRTREAWRSCVKYAKDMYFMDFVPVEGLETANSYAVTSIANKWNLKDKKTIGAHTFGRR